MSILIIRRHKRFAVRQAVRLRCAGHKPSSGMVVEVSLDGCRLAMARSSGLSLDQLVTLEIAQHTTVKAQVRWTNEGLVGLRFDPALHVDELDDLLQTCRAPMTPDLRASA